MRKWQILTIYKFYIIASCTERKLKSRIYTTIIQNTISNATFIFILCKRDPNWHFSPTHPPGNIADLLTRFHRECLCLANMNFIWRSRFNAFKIRQMHHNQNDGLQCLIYYLMQRPESEAALYSEEKWCASYAFLEFIRLKSLMMWICHWETLSWLAWSKRSQIHHWAAPCGPAVNRPTDTIWSYANLRRADFNSTHYLWIFPPT
jgi:hypothetical protein